MASRVVIQLTSDLSGMEIPDGDGETIEFAYRGSRYGIDLTNEEAQAFDAAMANYIKVGTKRSSGRSSGARTRSKSDAASIRAWAKENDIDVPERGRIPTAVRAKFESAT